MTTNKSQGQTLQKVGIYLPYPLFTHGQLYVALSRVGKWDRVAVLIDKGQLKDGAGNVVEQGTWTDNVVFREVLTNRR